MATTTRRLATEEDLLAMPDDGNKYELVDGDIRVSPGAGNRHGFVVAKLAARLVGFVDEHHLGEVTPLGPDDDLDGEDVLPGFRCSLRSVLE